MARCTNDGGLRLQQENDGAGNAQPKKLIRMRKNLGSLMTNRDTESRELPCVDDFMQLVSSEECDAGKVQTAFKKWRNRHLNQLCPAGCGTILPAVMATNELWKNIPLLRLLGCTCWNEPHDTRVAGLETLRRIPGEDDETRREWETILLGSQCPLVQLVSDGKMDRKLGRPLPQVQLDGKMLSITGPTAAWVAHVGLHLGWTIQDIQHRSELIVFHERGFRFDLGTHQPSWNSEGVGVEVRLLNQKPAFNLIPRGGPKGSPPCGAPGCANEVTAPGANLPVLVCCSALCFMEMQNLGNAEPAEEDAGPASTAPAPAPAGATAPAPAGASASGT